MSASLGNGVLTALRIAVKTAPIAMELMFVTNYQANAYSDVTILILVPSVTRNVACNAKTRTARNLPMTVKRDVLWDILDCLLALRSAAEIALTRTVMKLMVFAMKDATTVTIWTSVIPFVQKPASIISVTEIRGAAKNAQRQQITPTISAELKVRILFLFYVQCIYSN